MALNAGTAYVDVIPQLSKSFASDVGKDVSKASKNAEGDVEKAGSGIGSKFGNAIRTGVGVFAGFQAAEVLKNTFTSSISAASDLGETLSKTKVVFGDAGASVIEWSKKSAMAFGLSQNAALSAVSQYGDMFAQMGFAKTAAADMSTGMVQLAGDIGSFSNVKAGDVLERMGAALRGEYDSLQALIPTINAAAVEQEALAQTGKKTAKELTAQEKATATLTLIKKGAANADGDLVRSGKTYAAQTQQLSAKIENLKAKFGAVLLPAMNDVVGFMVTTFVPGIEKLGAVIGPVLGKVAEFIGEKVVPAIREAMPQIQKAIQDVVTFLQEKFFPPLEKAAKDLLPAIKTVAAFIADTLVPAVQKAVEFILPKLVDLAEFLGTVLPQAIEKAVQAIIGMYRYVDEHKTIFGVAAGIITTVFIPSLVAAGVSATINGAKIVAAWVSTQVAAISSAATTAAITAMYVADWILMGWQALLNGAKVVAGWVMTSAAAIGAGLVFGAQVALQVAGWVLLGAQSLINAAKVAAAWLIAMGPIGLVIAAVAGVVALIIANWDTIVEATKKLWNWVTTATAAAWDSLKSAVSKALDFLVTLFLNFTGPGLLIKHFDTIKDAAAAAFRWVADRATEFVNFFIGLPGKIAATTSGMFDGIKDAFRAALNAIVRMWNDLRFTLPEIDTHIPGVGKVGGFTLDTPNLPTFAKGGIARGTFIAGELGPELVTVGQTARIYTAGDTAMMTAGQGGSVVEKHYHYHNESKLEDPLVDQFKELERLGLPI